MDYATESLKLHEQLRGKIEIVSRAKVDSKEALSLAYTPGVAQPCLEIQKDIRKSYELTRRWNTVAVVTDGTAVLGLGDIGPEAGMPVMEGKCVLFKEFGGVDAIPLCIRSKNVDDIVKTVSLLAGSFGGINLEDISAPRCFEIEERLKAACDIPVFHDDQHGTAVIALAGLINALKVVGKRLEDVKIVTSGAGAAGTAIIKLMLSMGLKNVIMTDRSGAIYEGREGLNPAKQAIAAVTNREKQCGTLAEVIKGSDVFIGTGGADSGHDPHHGQGSHHLRLRQSHAGDLPRRGQGRWCGGGVHRPQRLSQPDQQCALLPRYFPRRTGRSGQPDHREYEDRLRICHCRSRQRRGADRRLYSSQGV